MPLLQNFSMVLVSFISFDYQSECHCSKTSWVCLRASPRDSGGLFSLAQAMRKVREVSLSCSRAKEKPLDEGLG